LAINDGQLCLKQIQVDNNPFHINIIYLHGAKVMVWLEQAESTKGKNVIIGEERPKSWDDKIWSREVVLEKAADGKDVLKITVRASGLGGKPATQSNIGALFHRTHRAYRSDWSCQPVRPVQLW
jgi:hypothetical protein